jgi:hypothetical protein
MRRFDGKAPLVEKKAAGRTWLSQSIDALSRMKPEELAKSDGVAKYYKSQFPAELTANGIDVAALRKWYQENEEYLFGESRSGAKIDPDLKTAGVSNRKPEFLDWLVKRLGEDPKDALALRLAGKYLGKEHGNDAATATAWITENRRWLFFTDTGGYRWMVNSQAKAMSNAVDTR